MYLSIFEFLEHRRWRGLGLERPKKGGDTVLRDLSFVGVNIVKTWLFCTILISLAIAKLQFVLDVDGCS